MGDGAKELSHVKSVIRTLLVLDDQGPLRYATLMQDYQAVQDCPMPYIRFGFKDGLSFLESLPDTVRVHNTLSDVFISAEENRSVRHEQALTRAKKARHPASCLVSHRGWERTKLPQLPQDVLENIMEVMGQGDVHARVLKETYCRRFGMPLEVEQYGFDSLEDCLAQIRMATENETVLPQDIVAVLAQHPDGIFMSRFAEAYARELGRPTTFRTAQILSRWPDLFRVQEPGSSGDFILLPASDATAVLQPPEPLPALSSRRVTDVRGCSTVLTVALQAPDSESQLARLGAAMNHFYLPPAFGPPFDARPGRPCAAFCTEKWRRARVVTVSGDLVQVELVDVGGRRSLAPHELRPLAPRFTELPALCVTATLAPPPGTRAWCVAADERLRELTQGCVLKCHYDGTHLELEDERGLLLTRQLASESLCKAAWRLITLSNGVSFYVVWVEERRYIFSDNLSRLLGWDGESARVEFMRRRIGFQCVFLHRRSASWCTLWPLIGRNSDETYCLFPADNIADAVNILCYPHTEVGVEVKRELAQLQD